MVAAAGAGPPPVARLAGAAGITTGSSRTRASTVFVSTGPKSSCRRRMVTVAGPAARSRLTQAGISTFGASSPAASVPIRRPTTGAGTSWSPSSSSDRCDELTSTIRPAAGSSPRCEISSSSAPRLPATSGASLCSSAVSCGALARKGIASSCWRLGKSATAMAAFRLRLLSSGGLPSRRSTSIGPAARRPGPRPATRRSRASAAPGPRRRYPGGAAPPAGCGAARLPRLIGVIASSRASPLLATPSRSPAEAAELPSKTAKASSTAGCRCSTFQVSRRLATATALPGPRPPGSRRSAGRRQSRSASRSPPALRGRRAAESAASAARRPAGRGPAPQRRG